MGDYWGSLTRNCFHNKGTIWNWAEFQKQWFYLVTTVQCLRSFDVRRTYTNFYCKTTEKSLHRDRVRGSKTWLRKLLIEATLFITVCSAWSLCGKQMQAFWIPYQLEMSCKSLLGMLLAQIKCRYRNCFVFFSKNYDHEITGVHCYNLVFSNFPFNYVALALAPWKWRLTRRSRKF